MNTTKQDPIIAAVAAALKPFGVEVEIIRTGRATCLYCPEKPRECSACQGDPDMRLALSRRGWELKLTQYTPTAQEREARAEGLERNDDLRAWTQS